jgi:hypothetical protein
VSALTAYRDDGALAEALGEALGDNVGRLTGGALILTVAGALPPLLVLGVAVDPPLWALIASLGWFVVLAGAVAGQPLGARLDWIVPPLLRAGEYGLLLLLTLRAHEDGRAGLPLAFGLLAALAFHHYDIVYRLRHQRVAPPRWLRLLAGGWEGRLLVALALFGTGLLTSGLGILAAILGIVFAVESASSWLRFSRAQRPALYEDQEERDE